jgi:hypothetical protein
MDIQTKIRDALADFDGLLIKGHPIREALCIASSENGVSERILESRASREMSLEERRDLVIRQAEGDRQSASQASIDKAECRQDGYWVRSTSGKRVWVDPRQIGFEF